MNRWLNLFGFSWLFFAIDVDFLAEQIGFQVMHEYEEVLAFQDVFIVR